MVEQNANLALQIAHRGYVLQNGRIVLGWRGGRTARQPGDPGCLPRPHTSGVKRQRAACVSCPVCGARCDGHDRCGTGQERLTDLLPGAEHTVHVARGCNSAIGSHGLDECGPGTLRTTEPNLCAQPTGRPRQNSAASRRKRRTARRPGTPAPRRSSSAGAHAGIAHSVPPDTRCGAAASID